MKAPKLTPPQISTVLDGPSRLRIAKHAAGRVHLTDPSGRPLCGGETNCIACKRIHENKRPQ